MKDEEIGCSCGCFVVLVGVTTLVLGAFKVLEVINWSWGWVLSPLWIAASLVAMFFVGAIVLRIFTRRRNERRV